METDHSYFIENCPNEFAAIYQLAESLALEEIARRGKQCVPLPGKVENRDNRKEVGGELQKLFAKPLS